MSFDKADYAKAETAAFETLIGYCAPKLPVDVVSTVEAFCPARVMTYDEAVKTLGMDPREFYNVAASDAAFIIRREAARGAEFLVLTSAKCGRARGRFSMAHELGHVALGHSADSKINEIEANVFAAAFLCPRPILRATGMINVSEVAAAFGISLEAASIAVSCLSRPDRADKAVCAALLRHFGACDGKRVEEYMDFPALADFYGSRLRRKKSPSIPPARPTPDRRVERALDEMERLWEIRMNAYY